MNTKWDSVAQRAWEAILERLRELRNEGCTLQELADRLGVGGRALIGEWLNGHRKAVNTSFPSLMAYLERLDLDYRTFFPDEPCNPSIKRTGAHSPVDEVAGSNLPQIPVMGATRAGDAVELFNATPDMWISVLPQYYRKDMIGLVVEGDSMEPTIRKGAVVGVAPYDGHLNDGGIYLISLPPFGRTIKRARMEDSSSFVLCSDNSNYPPAKIPFDGYERIIIGRILWIWQQL